MLFKPPQLFNVKNDYFNLNQFEMVGIWFGVIPQSVFSQLCVYVLYAFLWFAPKYVRLWLKYIKRLLYRLYVCFYTFFYIYFFCVVDSLSTANTLSFSFSLASSLCPLHFLSWRWNVDFKILCFFHSLHEKFISVNFFFHFILHASVSLSHFSCLLIIRTMNFSNFFFRTTVLLHRSTVWKYLQVFPSNFIRNVNACAVHYKLSEIIQCDMTSILIKWIYN